MAEILVMAKDNTHTDPEKDQRGCYKRGMPVVVMPDGHKWGKKEGPPEFFIIKLPGVAVDAVQKYLEPQQEDVISTPDDHGTPPVVRRRRWQFKLDDMPSGIQRQIADGGITVAPANSRGGVSWLTFRGYLKDLKTGKIENSDL